MKNGTFVLPNGDIEILLPFRPATKKNSQNLVPTVNKEGKKVHVPIPSKNYKEYESISDYFLKALKIDYPINVKALYFMPTRRKVDLNNLHSALHDNLTTHNVIVDDNAKVIVSTDGSRVYYDKENPRTEITITKTDPTFIV